MAKPTPFLRKTLLAATVAAALGVGALGAGQAIGAANPEGQNLSANAPVVTTPSFRTLAKQVRPAVVNISTEGSAPSMGQGPRHPFQEFFERRFGPRGFAMPQPPQQAPRKVSAVGSGFIVDPAGYVLTNEHVIRNAEKIFVTLDDGTKLEATVVGRDSRTDLGVLKIEGDVKFPYVELGNSDSTEVGDWVVAVGNPFGLGGTVTAGILSARGRDINSGPYDDYLQIDAPINRGSSGGPLFNTSGRVVGINTAIFSPSGGNVGIGFAVPANMAKPILEEIIAKGFVDRGWLGVHIQPVTDAIAAALDLKVSEGALVSRVADHSPAEKAGLKVGDIVIAVDGSRIGQFRDLSRRIGNADAGDTVSLEVLRDGKALTLPTRLGALPDAQKVSKAPESATQNPSLGLRLAPITPKSRTEWSLDESVEGALVAQVRLQSPAAKAGLRPGDVIVRANMRPVSDPGVLRDEAARAADDERPMLLLVARGGTQRFVTIELG
ncbi:MAG: DegQ family serine endoprotease [Pseudomonadota bacterium]